MAIIFTDQEIAGLIQEPKPLPSDYQVKIQIRPKRGHKERELDLKGSSASEFRLVLRQSLLNPIEGKIFYDFHIHQATQRYQEIGAREDTFAEPSDRFADLQQAIKCLFTDCGFQMPYDPQGKLFEEI